MGNVYQNLTLRASKEKKVRALIDSGAETTIIRPDIARAIGAGFSYKSWIILPNGKKERADAVSFFIKIKEKFVETPALVYPIKEPILIGSDFLQYNKAFIDFSKDKISFNRFAPKIRKMYRI